MAFGKKKFKLLRLSRKTIGYIIIGILLLIAIAGLILTKFLGYEKQLKSLKTGLKREAFIATQKINAGASFQEGDFYFETVYSDLSLDKYATSEDFGKTVAIAIEPGTPVLKSMLYEEEIKKDIREEELNMILLASNLEKNQYVDLRIGFPNGEDYIVLSKKKVRNIKLESNTIWLWLEEKEILTLSSAIVDAYLHTGTKLYTVSYVAPSIQDKPINNYPVNRDVLQIIKSNPNIVAEARQGLSEEMRILLEERLSKLSKEASSSIDSRIKEEAINRGMVIQKESEALNSDQNVKNEAQKSDNIESNTNNKQEETEGEFFY